MSSCLASRCTRPGSLRPRPRPACLAAGLFLREITRRDHEAAALAISGSDPELADAALAALLIAAGRDGASHQGSADAAAALQAGHATDQLASAFYRYQQRHD